MHMLIKLLRNQIYRYYAFVFFTSVSFFSAVLVPFFTDWGHLSLLQVQLLQSWFMFWVFVLEIPTGAVADYLGRKTSLVLGAATLSLAVLVYGLVPQLALFLLAEFLFALSLALISGADQAWLYDTLLEQGQEHLSKKMLGRAEAIHLAGMLVGAPIGSVIASTWGINVPMLASAVPFALAVFVGLSLREPKLHTTPSETTRYLQIVVDGLKYFAHHKRLRLLAIDSAIVSVASYFVIWLYQPLFSSVGVGIAAFGFIHAALLVAEIIISNHFEFWERLFNRWQFHKVTAVITALGFLIAGLAPSPITAGIFVLLAGGFGLTRITYMSIKMQPLIDSHRRATVLSSISMFRRFALVIFNPIVGLLADQSLSLALIVVGLLPLIVLTRYFKDEPKEL